MAVISNVFSTPTIGKARPSDANTVGTVTSATGLSVEEFGDEGFIRRTVFTFTAFTIALTRTSSSITANSGAGTPGKIYTFPIGYIQPIAGVANLTLATGFATSSGFVMSVGSAQAAADATLTSTEANFMASTAAAIATSAGTFATGLASTVTALNGSATAIALYLNAATADDTTASSTLTITGTLTITWQNIGDI